MENKEAISLREWAKQNHFNLPDEQLVKLESHLRDISTLNNIKDGERNWEEYLENYEEEPQGEYVVLVSYGWIVPTEFTVVERETGRVIEHHAAVQTPMEEWKELALELNGKYSQPTFYCDSAEPDRNHILSQAGIIIKTSKHTRIKEELIESVLEVRKEATETMGENFTPVVMVVGRKKEYVVSNIIRRLEDDYGFDVKLDKNGNFDLLGVKVVTILLDDPMLEDRLRGFDAWYLHVDEYTSLSAQETEMLFKRLRGGKNPSTNYIKLMV